MDWRREFKKGIKSGLPIGIGYIPVSFTFGFLAVSGGLPIWVAVVISLTNLTSAGQFAGTNLIFAGAGYLEVALTTFVINIRYMLMSLSLSQKLERKTGTLARLALAFGITDETFVVGSLKPGTLTAPFMLGLNWSSTERMSSQQADMLTTEMDAIRRTLTPVVEKVCRMWLRTQGYACDFEVVWDTINLQDEVEDAKAQLYLEQARQLRLANDKEEFG